MTIRCITNHRKCQVKHKHIVLLVFILFLRRNSLSHCCFNFTWSGQIRKVCFRPNVPSFLPERWCRARGWRQSSQALTRHSALTSTGHCAAQLQPYDQTHSVPACNSHFLADSAHWPHHTSATHTVADTGRTTPTGGARPREPSGPTHHILSPTMSPSLSIREFSALKWTLNLQATWMFQFRLRFANIYFE